MTFCSKIRQGSVDPVLKLADFGFARALPEQDMVRIPNTPLPVPFKRRSPVWSYEDSEWKKDEIEAGGGELGNHTSTLKIKQIHLTSNGFGELCHATLSSHITLPLIYLMAIEAATVCGSPLYMAPEILSLEAKVMKIAQDIP